MSIDTLSAAAEPGLPPGAGSADDLSPLAWVYGELRRALETANRALRRYRREADAIGQSDVDAVDPSVLRTARAQLHQGVGALELVGLPEVARVLRASEAAVQRMVARPVLADAAAIAAIEQVSFALLDYLARQLAGKPVSPVQLFPQYRAVLQLAGADRVHPADLWRQDWRWEALPADPAATPRAADDDARSDMESLVLPLMRQPEPGLLARMSDLCADLGAGARASAPDEAVGRLATFWYLAAAVFEAQARGLLASDAFNKRIASRLLAQLRLGGVGGHEVSDRLAQDMLFFCAHAKSAADPASAPRLDAVRRAWQLDDQASNDYETPSLGRFDPAQVALARKRVAAATEAWSAACGGELFRLPGLAEQFSLVGDSVQRLFPAGAVLSQALQAVMTGAATVDVAPPAPLAMEVATSMLYLDASLEDGNLDDPDLPGRLQQLGQRIDQVREGGEPQPMQGWMEDLYRRVSDRQTMGSVVHELRASLSEVEKQIDLYFRDPAQRNLLIPVPGQLQAMRGVLTVLGMDQASQAVLHLRDDVEALAQTEVDPQRAIQTGTFDRLADNLGALSFLIDMLSVQPALAKSLFRYDPATGSLSAVMGQSERVSAFAELDEATQTLPLPARALPPAVPPPLPPTPPGAASLAPGSTGLEDDAEMRGIFVDEALEVVAEARVCLARLEQAPDHAADMNSMRRAFHTLKGSARMIGLRDFGDAAWSCEQLYNSRLALSTHMDVPLRQFTAEALDYLGGWTRALASGADEGHASGPVTLAADALRLQGVQLPIVGHGDAVATAEPAGAHFVLDFDPVADTPVADTLTAAAAHRTLSLTDRIPDLPSAADLDLGLPDLDLDLPPIEAAPAPPALPPAAAADALHFEFDLADLDDFRDEAALGAPVAPTAPVAPPQVDFVLDDTPSAMELTQVLPARGSAQDLPPAEPAAEPVEVPEVEPDLTVAESPSPREPDADPSDEEQVRVIGPLRIGIPLFNIFLNEADELSRRLGTELAEWALEYQRHPVPAASAVLAHSLAGNSATVGYTELSALARALEHALLRSSHAGPGQPGESALFTDVAEEIRRLLHQFAAGFLRSVQPGLMDRLAEHERLPAPSLPDSESDLLADAMLAATPTASMPTQPPLAQRQPHFVSLPAGPAARAATYDDDIDFEIDAVDDIDLELFPIFDEEASELLLQLQTRLHEWHDQPEQVAAASACMRTLHTFKGGARLAGAMRLGEMAHRLETAIEHQLSSGGVQAADIASLLARADAMQGTFEAVRAAIEASGAAAVQRGMAAPARAEPALPVRAAAPVRSAAAAASSAVAAAAAAPGATGTGRIAWERFTTGDAAPAAAVERQAVGVASVRVRAGLLDRLVNQAGEVSITRARIDADVRQLQGNLTELGDSLDRMRRQLRDIELQAETQISTRLEAAKAAAQAFDPLEMDRFTRFQELTRFMAESVNDVGTLQRGLQRTLQSTEDQLAAQARLTRELQDDLLRTRMVEFESMADRFYRTVRQASKDTGKQVRLDIVGGAIEIDRGVLDRMTGPFEHLLRNSVAHGIEPPEHRVAAGKEAGGRITVTVAQAGNEVAVEFADDGAGLDLPRIRQIGIERGLLQPGQSVTDADLTRLIFSPGFSTADSVTELAGRGVGMDVVRADVNAMGGRIETASTAGQGTQIKLLLPLTTAVTQVVMLRCGGLHIAVPASLVEVVRRVNGADVDAAYASGVYDFNGESVPFFWMAALLAAGSRGEGAASDNRTQSVVVIRSAAQRVALHVDDVVGNQEVVVKNVGPQLSRLPGLAGVTLLSTGSVALIYNPVALAAVYGDSARQRMQQAPSALPDSAQPVQKAPLVLVVDDSLTVRRVTQRLLAREGYRVTLAKDGVEALARLAEERPAVLLTDIEMPRMDGFDLLRNVRAEPRLAGLPVVMITSRIAQKHRDFAVELGVDHYLGKPFSEENLLALVALYASAAEPPAPVQ